MELWQVAIPVADDADAQRLRVLLAELRVPQDPCAGDRRYETTADGARRMLVIVNARAGRLAQGGPRFRGRAISPTSPDLYGVLIAVLAIFAWIPAIACNIRQLRFRIRNCRRGNDNGCIEL